MRLRDFTMKKGTILQWAIWYSIARYGEALRAALIPLIASFSNLNSMETLVVGTYTTVYPWVHGTGEGLYTFQWNSETGKLSQRRLVKVESDNPTYLTVHPSSSRLFLAYELSEFRGEEQGALGIATLQQGQPQQITDQIGTGGQGACHVAVDRRTGNYVFVANYVGGNLACVKCEGNKFVKTLWTVQHQLDSPMKHPRQDAPHCHCVYLICEDKLLVVADLGTNQCYVYKVHDATTGITEQAPALLASFSLSPEAGPRHVVQHQSLPVLYVLNELTNTVAVYRYAWEESTDDFSVEALQEISTLPDGYEGETTSAALRLSADGRYLYTSNRGHDSLAIFSVSAETGALEVVGHQSVGQAPRDFLVHPSAPWLFVANQDTNNIFVFRQNVETGTLERHQEVECPSPVCLLFSSHQQ